MAHQLTINDKGLAEMAYVGQVPWHGLGQRVDATASIDEWQQAAGLNFTYKRSNVHFMNGSMHEWGDYNVLYRSDNNAPMSVVSSKYRIVQPDEVLGFFRDLVADDGFTIETVGSLRGGKRLWALARTNVEGEVVAGDEVKAYLLLATSCDGSLATTGMYTSIRVVCNNTLGFAMQEDGDDAIRIRHNRIFDPLAMKGELGLLGKQGFHNFMTSMRKLQELKIGSQKADSVLRSILPPGDEDAVRKSKGYKTIMGLFEGNALGSQIEGVAGTGWGLLNAITEYTDHHVRERNPGNRLNSAWFGAGAVFKDVAMSRLLDLAEA